MLRLAPGTGGDGGAATAGTALPRGYAMRSLADAHDLRRLDRLLHRGFDHPGEPPGTAKDLAWRERSISSPSTVRELNAVVVAPGGAYAAYCGVWHDPRTSYAMVEPVCADPDHRRRGCASAAVRAALARCAARGATHAYVGSDLPFYTALGFVPTVRGTWWVTV